MAAVVKDGSWVRAAFLVSPENSNMTSESQAMRFFTTAELKHGDTSLGGNAAINPHPQFTKYCDPPVKGLYARSEGMGRFYSEVFDDNQQVIHMRFGVPRFNSLMSFFNGFYNSQAGAMARKGRISSILHTAGKIAGFFIGIATLIIPITFVMGIGADAFKFFTAQPRSKYYYLKPTMPSYWMTVGNIVNELAVNRKIIPYGQFGTGDDANFGLSKNQQNNVLTLADVRQLTELLPDIWIDSNENGLILDPYRIAARYQKMANRQFKALRAGTGLTANPSETIGQWKARHSQIINEAANSGVKSTREMIEMYAASAEGDGSQAGSDMEIDKRVKQDTAFITTSDNLAVQLADDSASNAQVEDTIEGSSGSSGSGASGVDAASNDLTPDGYFASVKEYMATSLDDGFDWVSFRVDNTGSKSESFSSGTRESDLKNKINSMSSDSRNSMFNIAGGNLSDGIVGKTVGKIIEGAKDVVAGIADGLGVQGIVALGGAALVDIPEHWESSSADMPKADYSFTLTTPYGNAVSQLMAIYYPLSLVLAGALPLATGKASYTSPFLCQVFDRGRCTIRLGIIDNLSISRGVTNLPFDNQGNAMGIEVSFSVKDLSTIMYVPVVTGFKINPKDWLFDDESAYGDYMAVLAGVSMRDQVYKLQIFKRNWLKYKANFKRITSPALMSAWVGDTAPLRFVSAFYRGVEKK